MVKIEQLLKKGKISRINELELERYINFFTESYINNLQHSENTLSSFPRWSIISGYYAMHDITKLLIAKKFMLKVEFQVHKTTINVLKELVKNKDIIKMIKHGYHEFRNLANDLAEAKKERVGVQYYTGTKFLKEEHAKKSIEFHGIVVEYIQKIKELMKEC